MSPALEARTRCVDPTARVFVDAEVVTAEATKQVKSDWAAADNTSGADAGTATGTQTSTTLQDTGKSWTTNQWAGHRVRIVAGTGAGQDRTVLSNTGATLTVTVAWGTTPVSGSSIYVLDPPLLLDDGGVRLAA